jgi:hypothetical protein
VRSKKGLTRAFAAALLVKLSFFLAAPTYAQQPGSGAQGPTPCAIVGTVGGHLAATCGGIPSVTNITLDDGSNDVQGSFVGTSTSGTMTFAVSYVRAPFCDVTAYSGTQPVYTVAPAAITFTTIASGTRYTYQCFARPGG